MTRRPIPLAAVLLCVAATLVGTVPAVAQLPPDRTSAHAAATKPARLAKAPLTPPARMCGSRAIRHGKVITLQGAVVVRPSQRLDRVVARHRAGTTFWLKGGTYTFGRDPYAQVQPKSHDTIVGAPGVVIDGRRRNRYAFGGNAVGVTLRYLTIQNFGTSIADNQSEGVVNHDAGHRWHLRDLTVRRNAGAGIFLGSGDVIRDSCLVRNGQYGFSAYAVHGVRHLRIRHTEIAHNNTADWESRMPGCGCAGGGKFWAVRGATIRNNYVHDNRGVGLWADTDNTGFLFQGNYVARNTNVGIMYETSYNAHVVANTFTRNALVDGPKVGFPQPALYISESGSDRRAGARFAGRFLIARNRFVDNYSGVVLWENANRFVGSPDNSSSGNTTLVNPRVATIRACRANIRSRPYINDCRWKTRKVRVVRNTFILRKSEMPAGCRAVAGCGYVGVFSQYGSVRPFLGDVVPGHITFHQGNRFRANTYVGPWHFMVWELGDRGSKTWKQWRSAPYHEDRGSTRQAS